MTVMRAIQSFATGDIVVQADTLYDDDHPLVRQFPSHFVPAEVISRSGGRVEAATAAPGEKRTTNRPK